MNDMSPDLLVPTGVDIPTVMNLPCGASPLSEKLIVSIPSSDVFVIFSVKLTGP